MKILRSMRKVLADPEAFGGMMSGSSWYGWRVLLIAAAGERLHDDERVVFKKLTGRDREPGRLCHDLIVASGRRSGKTEALTIFSAWLSIYCSHTDVLAPGEIGVLLVISRDQRAAMVVLERLEGVLLSAPESSPLRNMIANRTAESLTLANKIRVEVRPCNKISGRGATFVEIIADEIGFWFTEVNAANPDTEILAACRPGLLTTGGPVLMASSVYAKRGVLYDSYKKYYGADGPPDIIVAYATSRDLNPSLPQEEIDRALERDPTANRAEYLSEWRTDTEGFIGRDVVEGNVGDYLEMPPQPGIMYHCGIDPASGVDGGDSFAIVISHKAGELVIIDAIREAQPPFNFFDVVDAVLLPLCKAYNIHTVYGDNWAGELVREAVRKAGLTFELAKKHKSQLYQDPFLPLLNARRLRLPRHERAINQICNLERSVQKSGRDTISHVTNGRDDVANAIALAVDLASNYTLFDTTWSFVDGVGIGETPQDAEARHAQEADRNAAWRHSQFENYLRGLQYPGLNPMTGRPRSSVDSMQRVIIWR